MHAHAHGRAYIHKIWTHRMKQCWAYANNIHILYTLSYIRYIHKMWASRVVIYIIIPKNIRHLLWNRGAWRLFLDTYLEIEVQGIRCTNHLYDSCPLTDVNPHFTDPGCRYYFKINSWWHIVMSSTHGPVASFCDVTMAHCSNGYLWKHDVEVDTSAHIYTHID